MRVPKRVIGGSVLAALLGSAAARQFKQPTPAPAQPGWLRQAGSWARDNPLTTSAGIGATILGSSLLVRRARRRQQEEEERRQQERARQQLAAMAEIERARHPSPRMQTVNIRFGDQGLEINPELLQQAQKYGQEKQAFGLGAAASLGLRGLRYGRGVLSKGLGLREARAGKLLAQAARKADPGLTKQLQQAAHQAGLRGPNLLNPLNWMMPIQTARARLTAGGRLSTYAQAAGKNTKGWQKTVEQLNRQQPGLGDRATQLMTQTRIRAPGTGQLMAAPEAVAASRPGYSQIPALYPAERAGSSALAGGMSGQQVAKTAGDTLGFRLYSEAGVE